MVEKLSADSVCESGRDAVIPEDRPFDVDAWNAWVDYPIQIRPVLNLAFVEFQVRIAEWLKARKR